MSCLRSSRCPPKTAPSMTAFVDRVVAELPGAIYRLHHETYVDASVALEVVQLARAANVVILGIEGFMVKEPNVYPSLDRIADFSRRTESVHGAAVRRSCAEAFDLLTTTWLVPPAGAPEGQMSADGVGGRYMIVFVFGEDSSSDDHGG